MLNKLSLKSWFNTPCPILSVRKLSQARNLGYGIIVRAINNLLSLSAVTEEEEVQIGDILHRLSLLRDKWKEQYPVIKEEFILFRESEVE